MKGFLCFLAIFIFISCSQNAVKEDNSPNENITKSAEEVLVEKKANLGKQKKAEEISQEEVKSIFKNHDLVINSYKQQKRENDMVCTFEVTGTMKKHDKVIQKLLSDKDIKEVSF